MKSIKGSVLAIFAVALVLGISACSTTKQEPAPAAAAPMAPVELAPKPDRG
jgi:predicted component of type VI protein secretion system